MASTIQVANRALTKIGAARIISFDDDNKQARALKSCFEDLRDDELRAHRWSFAIKRASLAADSTAPAFGYQYQFTLPSDFLRLDMVNDQYPSIAMDNYIGSENQDWQMEGEKILTDLSAPLYIRYGSIVTDPNVWDVNFREALACRIAAEVAEDLTQSNEKRKLAWEEYKMAINKAIRSNAIERPPMILQDNQWIIGRI
jgi:hypothetical protein